MLEYLNSVTVAPVTSTIRGVPSEVLLDEDDGMKGPCAVNLHNVFSTAQLKIGKRVCSLSEAKFRQICRSLRYSLDCGFE
jgi:mRNA interferase MazF